MKLPRGRLVRSRVVSDPRTVLVDALDRELTGYAVLEPQGSLLLDDDGEGVLTFDDGVPVVAYHTGTHRGGPPALADLAAGGPYRLELYALDRAALDEIHDRGDFRVPPGMPADRLAGDKSLADRTRTRVPEKMLDTWPTAATAGDATEPSGESSARAGDPSGRSGNRASRGGNAAGGDVSGRGGDASGRGGDTSGQAGRPVGAVEAFLDDEEKIEAIREQARTEAERRAEEWDFGGVG